MKTIIGWPGGKSNSGLAKSIVSLFPEHVAYVEPFMGSLAVFFAKTPSRAELVNDIHGELVNFFRIVKTKPERLVKLTQYTFSSEEMYKQLKFIDIAKLNRVERAFRFLYLVKNAFGQRYEDAWGIDGYGGARYDSESLIKDIVKLNRRLAGIQILNRSYTDLPKSLDRVTTLYYIDPPYFNVKHDKGYGGDGVNFKEFVLWIRSIEHAKIAISHDYYKPLLRALPGWTVTEIGTRQNSLSRHKSGKSKGNNAEVELLITNFKPVKKSRRSFI